MARPRKGPWRRKEDGCWYTTRSGERTPVKIADANVSPKEAHDLYCEFHSANGKGQKVSKPEAFITVSYLIDEYLEWCQKNRAPLTYQWYRDYLVKFHEFHGSKLRVTQLKPYHVHKATSGNLF